jgi:hypothetical protein
MLIHNNNRLYIAQSHYNLQAPPSDSNIKLLLHLVQHLLEISWSNKAQTRSILAPIHLKIALAVQLTLWFSEMLAIIILTSHDTLDLCSIEPFNSFSILP